MLRHYPTLSVLRRHQPPSRYTVHPVQYTVYRIISLPLYPLTYPLSCPLHTLLYFPVPLRTLTPSLLFLFLSILSKLSFTWSSVTCTHIFIFISREQFLPLLSAAEAIGVRLDISSSKTLADTLDLAVKPEGESCHVTVSYLILSYLQFIFDRFYLIIVYFSFVMYSVTLLCSTW